MNARTHDTVRLAVPAAVLHGYVARPAGGAARLQRFDADLARRCAGVVDIVARGNFLAVVADTRHQAKAAAAALQPVWRADTPPAQPMHTRTVRIASRGDAATALAQSAQRVDASYRWPLLSPRIDACGTATAEWRHGTLHVWLACTQPAALRTSLAALLDVPESRVLIVCDPDPTARHDNYCAAQAAADAALMTQVVGRPVQAECHAADLTGASAHVTLVVSGALAPESAYRIAASAPAHASQPLALAQIGTASPAADDVAVDPGLVPPYAVEHLDVTATLPMDVPSDIAARGQVFAHESHWDELAVRADLDPLALRLRSLEDCTGTELIKRVAAQSGWRGPLHGRARTDEGVRHGRGFAYASVVDVEDGRPARTWSAWVADVEVDSRTGDVSVTRVTVGHEREVTRSDAPARPTSLKDDVTVAARQLTAGGSAYDAWGDDATAEPAFALATHATGVAMAAPTQIDVVGSLAGSAAATLPAAAAVANAIHDATGIRLREPPFSAGQIREALATASAASDETARQRAGKRRWLVAVLAPLTALAGLFATVMPWRAPIAPVAPTGPGFYSAATIERGRLVAAAGDCAVCHSVPGGARNAGGLGLETPFGTVYSTNITPDVETGIGNWSYAAFERAMREGIHRDGRRLYPAFPYTAFAKVSDSDMQALYAYLMSTEPVASRPPETQLAFPFNLRPALAGWNALFHRNAPYEPDASRSALWNRGAYLAEGLGHCSACHSPRNALGAEKGGKAYLTGGEAEGWEAPALTALSKSPVPWTEDDLFQYLRTGYAARHGAAAGPMAPVVESLRELPASDVRAIAHYVASFQPPAPDAPDVATVEARSDAAALRLSGATDRLYQSACAVCHQGNAGVPQFGVKPSLALNSNLHSVRPDNVIQAVLHGSDTPPQSGIGYMPGFADSFDDAQVTELVHYLRQRFAPGQPAWHDVEATVARIRQQPKH
ncbi:c-type cytochrome [Cupriavidus sp. H18C2]|uniref:c-type cytochrome n=1 Tax=Cupriavidus sp. H18C2 TaxID=3241602 RepID=UPI003BF88B30